MPDAVVNVPLPQSPYRIHIATGGLDRLGQLLAAAVPARLATVITDETVAPLYADQLGRSLPAAGIEFTLLTIPAGESSKSLNLAAQLFDELAAARHARNEPIIALGGGVVGDLAGFVAATWHRGVPFVQCPTTLEAMIDASIGGKTAVNHAIGKNLIGAFHQPLFVMIDPACLATLAQRDITAALAESIKHAVITPGDFLDWHEANIPAIRACDPACMAELIRRNCEIKAAVVGADEREQFTTTVGRAALNFGHTIGHALEQHSHYDLRHGEAVALGMVGELDLAVRCCAFPEADRIRIERLMESLGLPITWSVKDAASIYQDLHLDKKAHAHRLRFAIPRRPGEIAWLEAPPRDAVLAAIQRIAQRP